jgi:hypothetical protein
MFIFASYNYSINFCKVCTETSPCLYLTLYWTLESEHEEISVYLPEQMGVFSRKQQHGKEGKAI